MLDEHAKKVAMRVNDDNKKKFRKILKSCGWSETEIDEMWEYKERKKKGLSNDGGTN